MAAFRDVRAQPALVERNGKLFQPVRASLIYYGEPREAALQLNGAPAGTVQLTKGAHSVEALAPAVEKETAAALSLVLCLAAAQAANDPE